METETFEALCDNCERHTPKLSFKARFLKAKKETKNWKAFLLRLLPKKLTPFWACFDCAEDTDREYYMIHDDLWEQAGMGHGWKYYSDPSKLDGLLCVGCLESRLGRQLTKEDFTDAPVNTIWMRYMSERLKNRIDFKSTDLIETIFSFEIPDWQEKP